MKYLPCQERGDEDTFLPTKLVSFCGSPGFSPENTASPLSLLLKNFYGILQN
jgi:hypothetical protein